MKQAHIYIILGLISHSVLINGIEQRKYFIDPGVTLIETWDGWGTSLAWWADVLGGLSEDVKTSITTAFFGPDQLNLNIVRYVIGGTTPNEVVNYTCGDYRHGAASESYKDGLGSQYNWTRDVRQRDILLRAKALGVNTFEAFSNSPPQWLTISGCSKGNPNSVFLHSNFGSDMADEFAEYATEVIRYFYENLGVTFTTYNPFNEPLGLGGVGSWAGEVSLQEGCNMDRTVMASVVRSVYAAISKKDLSFLSITTADETSVNTALHTQEFLIEHGLSKMISKINVHGYWDMVGNRRDLLSILSHKEGQRLWMSEMGWGESPIRNITQGLEIANRIVTDVRNMLPSAWIYWQVMEDVGGWGLIGFPFEGNQTVADIQYNSGYYAMMQFSKYIKQGYTIIYSSDKNSIAAIDEGGKTLVIVTINNEMSPISKHFDLRLFVAIGKVQATRTSANHPNVNEANVKVSDNKILEVETASESITTIIITDITWRNQVKSNLLKNGDFESEEPTEISMWNLELGEPEDGGINSEFSWRGNKSGFIASSKFISAKRRLSQVVKIPNESMSYQLFLSAWCSTTGSDTKLSVNVFGEGDSNPTETVTVSGAAYQMYSLTFKAKGGDQVKVQFDSFDGSSYIDNAILHLVSVEPEIQGGNNSCLDVNANLSLILTLTIIINAVISFV